MYKIKTVSLVDMCMSVLVSIVFVTSKTKDCILDTAFHFITALNCTFVLSTFLLFWYLFFNIFYWLCYYSCPIFFSSLYSPLPYTPPPTSISPPYFMSMDQTYKSFGFSTTHTILNLPLSILYLPFYPLYLFPHSASLPLPVDNPPCDLHFCESVPILVVCLVCFCFVFLRFGCWQLWVCCHFTVYIFDHLLFLR